MGDLQPEWEGVQGVEEEAFIKENIDVLRTLIKEHDKQAKTKANPKKLTYGNSEEEGSGSSRMNGPSERSFDGSSRMTRTKAKLNRVSSIPGPKDIIPDSIKSQRDDHSDDVPSETPEPRKEGDPRTYNEAMQSCDATYLKEHFDAEIVTMMENNTWFYLIVPLGCKPLGCKWIFKRKMKVDETIDKFKARLVIQGFRQKEGIDYFDTYAPVARITTIRLLLALAAIHNLVIHQMDVKTTFLNGEAYVILGIKIKRENKGIVITQSHYIEKILKKCNRKDCSRVSTPMDLVEKLKSNISKLVDQLEYSRAIGCLMYAMTSTGPDLLIQLGTMNYGLSYVGYPSVLEGYSDASWINQVEDSSSTSGWVFLLRRGAISWASKSKLTLCIYGSEL
ncbi:zinc finger, CCHC-type containing protein [Tanacetum coccineum]